MKHQPLSRLLLSAVVAGVLASGCQTKKEGAANALRWGADQEGGAPYITMDPATGKVVGFEVDLAEALAKELGRPIEFEQRAYINLVSDLRRNDIDLAMNGLEVTPDRQKIVRFSRPYYIYRLQLVGRNDATFTTLKDLQGKKAVTVGTLANTAASRLLERLGIPTKTYDDQTHPYSDLAEGRLDAVLLDLPIAIYMVQKNPSLNPRLKFVGEPIEPGQYAIAFRPEDEALAKQFDEALGRLIQNGAVKRIYEKWGLWNDDQKQLGADGPAKGLDPLATSFKR